MEEADEGLSATGQNRLFPRFSADTINNHPAPSCHSLDQFFGDWTEMEAGAFDRAVAQCRRIDPEMWQ